MFPRKKDDDQNKLKNDIIKCLGDAMIMLESKLESLSNEYDKIKAKGANMTDDDQNNSLLISNKTEMLLEIYQAVQSTKFAFRSAPFYSDINGAKQMYSSYMKKLVDAINDAKSQPEWQDLAKHRGFLGVIDKVLQLILGEWGKVKTSSERVADNVASKIDNARPTK